MKLLSMLPKLPTGTVVQLRSYLPHRRRQGSPFPHPRTIAAWGLVFAVAAIVMMAMASADKLTASAALPLTSLQIFLWAAFFGLVVAIVVQATRASIACRGAFLLMGNIEAGNQVALGSALGAAVWYMMIVMIVFGNLMTEETRLVLFYGSMIVELGAWCVRINGYSRLERAVRRMQRRFS